MGCMSAPNKRPWTWNKPLGEMVGKWEADLIRNHTQAWARFASRVIVKFFRDYPRKSHPRQVKVTDVEDYKARRRGEVSLHTLRSELAVLGSFFRFVYFDLGLDVPSPVIQIPKPLAMPGLAEENPDA